MARLVSTALMITLSPGSVSTMSDALRAASVASATAMPMSAFFSAGASFTPSPVIPQMCFISCSRRTISYLCSGNTPAKPSAFSISSSTGSPQLSPSLRRELDGYMLVPMPSRRPVS
uniref:Secreted protein n=1 Tax=Triticum urartu TaxID=4572 RepID=A0A8R7VCW1_TRIUA